MSTPGPFGPGDPFEGLPFLRDIAKMLASQGPISWDVARQLAAFSATGGEAEPNVDPAARIRLEELAKIADLHVAAATGMPTSQSGRPVEVRAVTRGEWAQRSLDAWRPVLERLAAGLGTASPPPDVPDPTGGLLGGIQQVMGPMLLGMQSGSMAGHLATTALGQYDLPIPRPGSDEILVVSRNLDELASDWSLPLDDVRLWVCLTELAHHAVLARPHVRERILELLGDHATGFKIDPDAIQSALGSFDPTDPSSLEGAFPDPAALLGAVRTEEQDRAAARLAAIVAAMEGWVDHVLDTVAPRLVSSATSIAEALRRRRVERGEGDRVAERLLGLEVGQAQYDRGERFVRGVLERTGPEGLDRLWRSAWELPTPAEVDAPGLWLERRSLPPQDPAEG